MQGTVDSLKALAIEFAGNRCCHVPMGSQRPSTVGKEFANVAFGYNASLIIHNINILGKINGAVGNYNAHAYPEIDWPSAAEEFIVGLGLTGIPTRPKSTYDYVAEIFNCLSRYNTILIDFRGYLGLYIPELLPPENSCRGGRFVNYASQGQSDRFRERRGNLGLANALLDHMSAKLPVSRWQRDLTDSTVMRNLGKGSGTAVAYQSLPEELPA